MWWKKSHGALQGLYAEPRLCDSAAYKLKRADSSSPGWWLHYPGGGARLERPSAPSAHTHAEEGEGSSLPDHSSCFAQVTVISLSGEPKTMIRHRHLIPSKRPWVCTWDETEAPLTFFLSFESVAANSQKVLEAGTWAWMLWGCNLLWPPQQKNLKVTDVIVCFCLHAGGQRIKKWWISPCALVRSSCSGVLPFLADWCAPGRALFLLFAWMRIHLKDTKERPRCFEHFLFQAPALAIARVPTFFTGFTRGAPTFEWGHCCNGYATFATPLCGCVKRNWKKTQKRDNRYNCILREAARVCQPLAGVGAHTGVWF